MYGVGVTRGPALPMPLFAQAAAALAAQGQDRTARSWSCSNCPAATTDSTRWSPTATTPITSTGRISASRRRNCAPIDDHFGFSRGMAGFERLYKDGKLAIVHGCGYENPSFSHFTSMAYWHTAAPNSGEEYGWVGRLADAMAPDAPPNFMVEYRRAAIARRAQPPARAGGLRRSQQIHARKSSTTSARFSNSAARQRQGRQSFAAIPAGHRPQRPATPRRWCAKPGRNIIRRWTTASSASICPRSPR